MQAETPLAILLEILTLLEVQIQVGNTGLQTTCNTLPEVQT